MRVNRRFHFLQHDTYNILEEKVKGLLEDHSSLESENSKLVSLLKVKKSEVEWLKERLRTLDKEKGVVKAKVDGLLESLEDIV
jgi:predicted nuclease with TOPRIM domain